MDGLPVELVAAIFRRLEQKDCIAVSHVCKRWRAVAIDDPFLWTRLAFDFTPIEGVETLVARSRNAPLFLSVGAFTLGEQDRLARVLTEHMAHILALSFHTSLRCYTDSLRDALCIPAPLMAIFDMHAHDDDLDGDEVADVEITLPPLLFGGVAPRLRHVDMHSVGLPSTCPALANVSSLRLHLPETPPLEPFCLSAILPSLLSLELINQSDEPHVSLKQDHCLIALDMTATWDANADLREPLRAVNHADLISVKSSTTNADTVLFVFDSILDVPSLSLGVCNPAFDQRWDTSLPAVSVSFSSSVFLRHFRVVEEPTVTALLNAPARMAAVTSLDIAHHLLCLAPARACLPALTRLYVEFPSEDAEMEYGHLALWLDAQRTPRLQTLILCGEWLPVCQVGYRPLTRPRTLSAARLAGCLKTRPEPPLPELRLHVQLEETPEEAYALLAPTVTSFSRFNQ